MSRKNRDKKPNPLDSKRLLENDIENDVDVVEYGDAHEKWSMEKAAKVFIASAGKLFKRNMQAIEFDKDDEDAVAFVTATAQLRCSNYDIEYMSRFDAKGVAGNIVHALATTNAIVSGLIVIEALKLLNAKKQLDSITTANNNSDGEDEGKNEGGNDKLVQLANSRYTFVGNFNQGRQLL